MTVIYNTYFETRKLKPVDQIMEFSNKLRYLGDYVTL